MLARLGILPDDTILTFMPGGELLADGLHKLSSEFWSWQVGTGGLQEVAPGGAVRLTQECRLKLGVGRSSGLCNHPVKY